MGLYVEQSVYDYFNQYQNELGVHSNCWEDWANRQVDFWNDMFQSAIYLDSPEGVLDRIRLDKVTIVPDDALPLAGGLPTNHPNRLDYTVDLQWGFPATLLNGTFYSDHTTISMYNPFYYEGSLFHELGHARYLIDVYGFNIHDDGSGSTVTLEEDGQLIIGSPYMPLIGGGAVYFSPFQGLMNGDYTYVDEYSTFALNLITGHRATYGNYNAPGNLGIFLQDLPDQNILSLKDQYGNSFPNANVKIYQATDRTGVWYGKYYNNNPDIELTADGNGRVALGQCPFTSDEIIEHRYGYSNGVIIIRVEYNGEIGYNFLEVTFFNMEYWRGNTNTGNYELTFELFNPITFLTFESASITVNENTGMIDIPVKITNPDGINPTSVNVELVGGTATNGIDIAFFSTQTLFFPAGSSEIQCFSVQIIDDFDYEGVENLIFELKNVSGGNFAFVGLPNHLNLKIYDDEIKIIISEIMKNPEAIDDLAGEWFELYNPTSFAIDIDGWRIRDDDPIAWDDEIIYNGGPLIIYSKDFLVLGRNEDQMTNGNYACDFEYFNMFLSNDCDEIVLEHPDGDEGWIEIDRVEYNDTTWVSPAGASMVYSGTASMDNNHPGNWIAATTREPTYVGTTGDLGSPGTNSVDQALPVCLTSFMAHTDNNKIILEWITASEINSMGFEILKSEDKYGKYFLLSSYKFNATLSAKGNSSTGITYQFADQAVMPGRIYWYKLLAVDLDGSTEIYGPISASIDFANDPLHRLSEEEPKRFELYQNFPNPFNPTTLIRFDIPFLKSHDDYIELNIYNLLGQLVRKLYSGEIVAGRFEIEWDCCNDAGEKLPAGTYLGVLKFQNFKQVIKMILLK